MKEGVHRPWTNVVAVMLEFLHHSLTEYPIVISMHQGVDANETGKEFPLMRIRQRPLLRP
jgi:hypothetical protein